MDELYPRAGLHANMPSTKLGSIPAMRDIANKIKYPEAYAPGQSTPPHGFNSGNPSIANRPFSLSSPYRTGSLGTETLSGNPIPQGPTHPPGTDFTMPAQGNTSLVPAEAYERRLNTSYRTGNLGAETLSGNSPVRPGTDFTMPAQGNTSLVPRVTPRLPPPGINPNQLPVVQPWAGSGTSGPTINVPPEGFHGPGTGLVPTDGINHTFAPGNSGIQARPPAGFGSSYVRPAVNPTNLYNFAKGTGAGLVSGLVAGGVNQWLQGKGLSAMQSGTSSKLDDLNTTAHLAGNLIQNGASLLPTLVGRAAGVDPATTIQNRLAQAGSAIHNFVTPADQLKAENAPDAAVRTAAAPNPVTHAPAPVNTNLTPPTTEGWVPGKLLSQIQAQQAKYDTNAVAAALAGNRGASPLDSNPAAVDTAYKAGVANRAPRTVEYKQPTQEEKVNKNEAWANQILKDPYFARYQPQTVDAAKTFLQSARAFRADQTERAKVQADFDLRRSNVDATNQERAYQHERDALGDKAAAAKAQRDEIRYQEAHENDKLKLQHDIHQAVMDQIAKSMSDYDKKSGKLGLVDAILGQYTSSLARKGLTNKQGFMTPETVQTVLTPILGAISSGASETKGILPGSGDPAEAQQRASELFGQWLSNLPDVE